jgi:hypothetical protein
VAGLFGPSSRSYQCFWPGCTEMVTYDRATIRLLGKSACPSHGISAICPRHRPGQLHGVYVPPGPGECLACYAECHPDAVQAELRNAESRRRQEEALARYQAQFGAQGYDAEASAALAKRKFADENPAFHLWSPEEVAAERKEADRQRQLAAGQLGRCPYCKGEVQCSQGVILAHVRAATEGDYVACAGEGRLADGA